MPSLQAREDGSSLLAGAQCPMPSASSLTPHSHAFDHHRHAVAAAEAEGGEAAFAAGADELMQERGEHASA